MPEVRCPICNKIIDSKDAKDHEKEHKGQEVKYELVGGNEEWKNNGN